MARPRMFEVQDDVFNPTGDTFVNVNSISFLYTASPNPPDFNVVLQLDNGVQFTVGTFATEAEALAEVEIWRERINDAP